MSALGLDSSSLMLPPPTETDSFTAPDEFGTELSHNDQQSIRSVPSDGSPVIITAHQPKARASTGQASFMIELFEGGASQASGVERKPSVRVRVTPSTTKSESRRSEGRSRHSRRSELEYLEDHLASPYASATEESTVSRNQQDMEASSKNRTKRPLSPLIPEPRSNNPPHVPGQGLSNPTGSDLSAIPTNSFLDDSGNSGFGDKRDSSPLLKNRNQKPARQNERERIRLADKPLEKEQKRSKSKSGRSRASSLSAHAREREREREKSRSLGPEDETLTQLTHRDSSHRSKSRNRRSSRGVNQDSFVSGVESVTSSAVSRAHDRQSIQSSEVNSKLLAAVEVALRKVVIPELEAIKRENSKRDSSRRLSIDSSVTGVSVDERSEPPKKPRKHRRQSSRSRHSDVATSRDEVPRSETKSEKERLREELPTDSDIHDPNRSLVRSKLDETDDEYYAETPRRSPEPRPARVSTGGSLANAIPSIISARGPSPPPPTRRRHGRRHRVSKRASDRYDEEFDDESVAPLPPMPLQSEVTPSEPATRTSLLTESDRPASATEELEVNKSEISEGGGALLQPDPQFHQIGMNLANVSHGDLRALPRGVNSSETQQQERGPAPFPEEYEPDEYGQKVRTQPVQTEEIHDIEQDQQYPGEEYEESEGYDSFYNQQVVPPHLKYVPYQPERRGLSPIYSVSGYTENSELQPRDSHMTNSEVDYAPSEPMSPRPNRRNSQMNNSMLNSEIMEGPAQSEISSMAGYPRNTAYTEDMSELDEIEPKQPVRTLSVNTNARFVPGAAVESVVASLIDGSIMDQSVTGPNQGYYGTESALSYGGARSAVSCGGDSHLSLDDPAMVRELTIRKRKSDIVETSAIEELDEDVDEEIDGDAYDDGSMTPTAEEHAAYAAITTGALVRAVQAQQVNISHESKDEPLLSQGAGVQRNKSFKERTQEGFQPASTPTHSVDRFDDDSFDESRLGAATMSEFGEPKMSANALPDFADALHYAAYVDMGSDLTSAGDHQQESHEAAHSVGELSFVAGAQDNISIGPGADMEEPNLTPRALSPKKSTTPTAQYPDHRTPEPHTEDIPRSSTDRKRETIVTNPYENMSPMASQRLSETFGYPGAEPPKDEGYVSNPTPDHTFGKDVSMPDAPPYAGMHIDDNFFSGRMSAMSYGMSSPMNDTSVLTNAQQGGNISNKDIMSLMQELVARDAQRNARDTEIAAMVMFLANEMRTHFSSVEDRIKQAEDVIIDEVQDSEKMVIKAINGPRPFPIPNVSRSLPGTGTTNTNNSSVGPDIGLAAKKGNFLRRALNGLNVTGAKDLSRIEVMLHQLLDEVMELKGQQGQPVGQSDGTYSQYGGDNDTRDGYDPEGHAGTSVASHSSYAQHSSSRLDKNERKYQDHRVSTVVEGEEEDPTRVYSPNDERNVVSPSLVQDNAPRAEPISVPTPIPEPVMTRAITTPDVAASSPKSNAKSEKSRKHKSGSSMGARFSRWSETASTITKRFRSSGGSSSKEQTYPNQQDARSRSGSDFGTYPEPSTRPRTAPYPSERCHNDEFQAVNRTPSPQMASTPPPASTYMTPDHPKYHVHRNSLNLQHPQPRQGNTERFRNNLESQAYNYENINTPRSADWGNSVTSLNRYNPASASQNTQNSEGPARPPKEPLDNVTGTPRSGRFENTYGSAYNGSPRSRDVERLAGMPTRRPSGPRAMTPKSPSEEAREERRRNRNTFGSVASRTSQVTADDTDTF